MNLAAPQVGLNIRMFVMNATGEPGDDRVYVNPVLTEASGEEAGEEAGHGVGAVAAEQRAEVQLAQAHAWPEQRQGEQG